MPRRVAPLLALFLAPLPAAAAGDGSEQLVEGEVVSARARWTAGQRSIVTESVVRTESGEEVKLRQLGGSVGGVGMWISHAPAPLRPGERVAARAIERPGRPELSLKEVLHREPWAPEGALPFVRTENKSGADLFWNKSCVFITYDQEGVSHIEGKAEFAALDAAFANWEQAGASCSFLSFRFEEPESREVGFDKENLVKFRGERWCRPGDGGEPEECYSPSAAGITTLFFVDDPESPRNGEIVDADIEFNAVDFTITIDGETQGPAGQCESDLQNTATHEVGHLLGLDHTCWDGVPPRPEDDEGEPIPSCVPESRLPSEVTEATMYNFQDCGETKKRSLEPDDIDGLCAIYPEAEDPQDCTPFEAGGGCCSLAGSRAAPGAAPLWLLTLLGLGFLWRRPRRARRGR